MRCFREKELREVGEKVLRATGVLEEPARIVADSLVQANIMGHDSHGIIRIPQYVRMVQVGQIRLDGQATVVVEAPSFAVVDGGWGFGQVAGRMAAGLAVEKAAKCGLGAVAVRSSNHMGRIGEFPESIARHGQIGLAFSNALAERVAPFGGIRPCLSPGVIAASSPRSAQPGEEEPLFLLDMTCSVVPEGKVRVSRNSGTPLPEGAVMDAQGMVTNDPARYYGPPEGALLPLGGPVGYKGYGLGLLCEMLAGALSGAGCSGEKESEEGSGLFLMALDLAYFGSTDVFIEHIQGLFGRVKTCPTAPGIEEIFIPGDIESRIACRRRRDGILVDEETWRQIEDTARSVGCSLDEAPVATASDFAMVQEA